MARNKKVEILSNDKEVLHPMTDGDCVIFEDGQTLTQKLSEDDSVKYTPEIVNSSPMFKVGEGNAVDYSDNVLDGAYERATLQGQTYVNYIQESSADEVILPTPFTEYERTQHNTLTSDEEGTLGINLVGQSYVNALQHDSEEEFVVLGESLEFQDKKVEYTNEGQIKSAILKGQTLVNLHPDSYGIGDSGNGTFYINKKIDISLIKPNTKYFIRLYNTHEKINKVYFKPCIRDTIYFDDINNKYTIHTTKADLSEYNDAYFIHFYADGSDNLTVDDVKNTKIILCEYQEGMENWDIPYFEGMQSVTVSTRLENLCRLYTNTSENPKTGKTFTVADAATRAIYLTSAGQYMNIKPNKKYMLQFKISNLVLDGEDSIGISLTDSATNALFKNVDGTNGSTQINSNGIYRLVVVASDIAESSSFVIKGVASEWENSSSSLRSMTISEIMCVEYQNGMENWDLPYFEDYQVMKPVQIESVNKNLFDGQLESGNIDINTGAYATSTERQRTVNFIPVKPNTTYILSNNRGVTFGAREYDNNKNYLGWYTPSTSSDTLTALVVTKNSNVAFLKFVIVDTNTDNQIQLEESSTATEYVPHQSKTTYSWDEVILRKVGDVEDTLDLTTGEWVQRIGEVALDGSETWKMDAEASANNSCIFFTGVDFGGFQHFEHYEDREKYQLCDKFKIKADTYYLDENCIMVNQDARIYCRILKTQLSSPDVTGFQEWLKTNNVKISTLLAKPIVHKVNLSRPNLQVYDDITHIHTKCLDGTLIPNIYLPSDISYPAILEPGKKYNVCVNHTKVSADNPLKVNVGGTEITMTDSRMTLTTPATLANSNVSFTGKGNKIKESMLIKNSSLLTRDLPHFNGIGSVQLGKTIENLCDSTDSMYGGCVATKTVYNDHVSVTVTKTGSLVICSNLIRPLENGKKYFVYAPNTFPTANACHVGFYNYYNNAYNFGHQVKSVQTGKCIIEIDQKDKLYTMITLGYHSTLPIGTYTINKPIICEYEPSMENWDWESIGYFTGTKNIGNEFMRVQNKNLININANNINDYFNNILPGTLLNTYDNGKLTANNYTSASHGKGVIVSLKPNTQYTITARVTNSGCISIHDRQTRVLHDIRVTNNQLFKVITTNNNMEYCITFATVGSSTNEKAIFEEIQIEESSTATTYTAHKHNGLYITKDQPIELTWEQGRINPSGVGDSYTNAINNAVSYGIRTKGLLNLKPNTTYRISLGDKANYKYHVAVFDNLDNALSAASSLGLSGDWVSSKDTIFTTTKDAHKIGINVQKQDSSSITPSESVHAQVRLEEVTDVVLRGIGDVHDELDITRGIYTQRIGEVVLDGSETWRSDSVNLYAQQKDLTYSAPTHLPNGKCIKDSGLNVAIGNNYMFLINQQDLPKDIEKTNIAWKTYLQANPITIQYQIATPIVHKVHIGNKNELGAEVTKPNDVFTLPTLYTEQTHIDLTNNGIMPKVQSRDYIAYPVLPMIGRTYTLQHNLTGGVSNLTVDLLGRTQTITYQNHKSLVYVPETMDAILHHELRISGKGKISGVMYIDGGYMDREIPYIEGMKNAVNPIVKNYTDTQENICYVDCGDEIIYLRSLPNGVHDEIDLETGKYIQRVGEITFNGTENWKVGYASWDNKRTYYNDGFVDIKTWKGDNGSGQAYYDALRCPQLHRSYMSRLASALIDGVCSYYYSGYQRIFISKQDCATVDELKLWLQENPITVQYELPEPIVKDIVIHNYPHSYEGGHVIIENGDPNTPIPAQLTYRAVTNRSGQIQQHTEQVEKQEREINELETLILANIHLSQTR